MAMFQPTFSMLCHGAAMVAEMKSTAQKCTTVGEPKARTSDMVPGACVSDISAITTNCKPVNAPADEPTIT